MAKLIIESGAGRREVPIGDVCRIGRDKSNELALEDPGLSRRHCRITREGDTFILEDLKSANGTQRNEEPVDRVVLEDGDTIQVGGVGLRFSLLDVASAGASAQPTHDEIELDFGGDEIDLGGDIQLEDPRLEAPEAPARPSAPRPPTPRPAATAPSGAGGAGTGGRYEVVFATGERAGERVRMAGDRITMGRRSSNTVVFKDTKVSGVHAEVAMEGARVVLRDLGSTNGTFLEGKRIDEIPLDHGDRVSVGDNEFVLVDSTKPAPDLSKSGFDADKTIVDMPKVKVVHDVTQVRRSPMPLIGTLAVLIGLGVGGWYWWTHRPDTAVAVDVPPAPGNMLGAAWSLESLEGVDDPADLWGSLGDHASFTLTSGGARTGLQAFSGRGGEVGAVSILTDPLSCTTRTYQIEAYATAEKDASARVVALFTDASGRQVGVPVGAVQDSTWTRIEGAIVPPTGAKGLQLCLVGAFDGRVRFDDLAVIEGDMAKPPSQTINQFDFERAGSVLLTRWGGEEVMRVSGLTFVDSEGARWSVESWSAGAESGQVAVGEASAHHATSIANDDRALTWTVEWRDAKAGIAQVSLPISVSGSLLDEPVGVLRGTELEPYEDSFEVDGVSGLVVGKGGNRMRVTIDPPVTMSGRRGDASFDLQLLPGLEAGKVVLRAQVDFREEKIRANELLAAARASQAADALGQASNELARIANEFPFDEATLTEAQRRLAEVNQIRDARLKELREMETRARFLRSPTAFDDAEAAAKRGAMEFAGTPSAEEFEALGRELAVARDEAFRDSQRRVAELLLDRMRTALVQKPPRKLIATEISDYLQDRYPWSEAAKAAVNEMEGN